MTYKGTTKAKGRGRGCVGTQMSRQFASFNISKAMIRVANQVVNPVVKPKIKKRGSPQTLFSPEQVAHIRWLSEREHWTDSLLSSKFSINPDYLYALLSYQTRGKIVPKRSERPDVMTDFSWRDPPKIEERVDAVAVVRLPVHRKKLTNREATRAYREKGERIAARAMARRKYFEEIHKAREEARA